MAEPGASFRVVIDTNTLLRGLAAGTSAAAKIRRAAERRAIIPLLSKSICDEYRSVLLDENIQQRFPEITDQLVEITIRRLRFIGEYTVKPRAHFRFQRDPLDEKFLEVAISLKATHIITSDKDYCRCPAAGPMGARGIVNDLATWKCWKPQTWLRITPGFSYQPRFVVCTHLGSTL